MDSRPTYVSLTTINPEYPIIKELDPQIFYVWQGILLIDRKGIIRKSYELSNTQDLEKIKVLLKTSISELLDE